VETSETQLLTKRLLGVSRCELRRMLYLRVFAARFIHRHSSSVVSDGIFTRLASASWIMAIPTLFLGVRALFVFPSAPVFPFTVHFVAPSCIRPAANALDHLVPSNMGQSGSRTAAQSLAHDLSVAAYLASLDGRPLLPRSYCVYD
jgi:hypothetical protein